MTALEVHWLKPGHGGPLASTYGGDFRVTSNGTLFNVDGNLAKDANPAEEDAAGAEDTGELGHQDQIEEDDLLEAIDEKIPNGGDEEQEASPEGETGPTSGEEGDKEKPMPLRTLISRLRTRLRE